MTDKCLGLVEELACCPPKVSIAERPLLDSDDAWRLETMFKVLANSTRLRVLHALVREPGLCVTELAETLGMKPQAVSNQLQRLVDRGILEPKRNGNQVHYRIVDPCVTALLDRGLCLSEDSASG